MVVCIPMDFSRHYHYIFFMVLLKEINIFWWSFCSWLISLYLHLQSYLYFVDHIINVDASQITIINLILNSTKFSDSYNSFAWQNILTVNNSSTNFQDEDKRHENLLQSHFWLPLFIPPKHITRWLHVLTAIAWVSKTFSIFIFESLISFLRPKQSTTLLDENHVVFCVWIWAILQANSLPLPLIS